MHVNTPEHNISFSFRHLRDAKFEIRDDKVVSDVTYCDLLIDGKPFSGLACCVEGDKFVKNIGRGPQ